MLEWEEELEPFFSSAGSSDKIEGKGGRQYKVNLHEHLVHMCVSVCGLTIN